MPPFGLLQTHFGAPFSITEFGTTVASLGTLLKLADPLVILKFKEGIADEMVRIKILPRRCAH